MHHVLVRHVGVGEDHFVYVLLPDDLLELVLWTDRNPVWVTRPGQLGRIHAALDIRDLRGREGDDRVLGPSAKEDVEVVKVAAGCPDDDDARHMNKAYADTQDVKGSNYACRAAGDPLREERRRLDRLPSRRRGAVRRRLRSRFCLARRARLVDAALRDALGASGSFSRLIVFDKRGTGMSDRVSGAPTLETRMDDVRAVMDAAGSTRAAARRSLGGRRR